MARHGHPAVATRFSKALSLGRRFQPNQTHNGTDGFEDPRRASNMRAYYRLSTAWPSMCPRLVRTASSMESRKANLKCTSSPQRLRVFPPALPRALTRSLRTSTHHTRRRSPHHRTSGSLSHLDPVFLASVAHFERLRVRRPLTLSTDRVRLPQECLAPANASRGFLSATNST
jgi:hypothetical protein